MISVAKTSEGFCVCGLQIETGEQFEQRNGRAVHVWCRNRAATTLAPAELSTEWFLSSPRPQPLDHPEEAGTSPHRPQAGRVLTLMESGQWHTLDEIAAEARMLETSASARLRELRSHGHDVISRKRADGSGRFEYRVIPRGVTRDAA